MSKRAVILAAGVGQRLQLAADAPAPKCLLRFDGRTLLERHLRLLRAVGVEDVVIVVGYEHQQIADELDRLDWTPRPTLILNPQYRQGSVVSVAAAESALCAGGDVLLMDADVLYDVRMLAALVADDSADRLLLDAGFEAGDEPVKLCLRDGRPVELRKKVADGLRYDHVGESVGFFRFTQASATRLAQIVRQYAQTQRGGEPHEEAVRDLLLESPERFACADVTGLPWLEIDFPVDVIRAREVVLPQLHPLL
ncbi:NTP transferase domain-containing protein [Robbsia sp. Bb-Pol-6]|uniref:NTP transferase domain-containing protein n=1 Tax=Robbsia betulipollinis TaxID=2981849 RepID=A0ABT3ZN22_9BURK|nr:NTP transferase domain-containing protein [Robbsia betulipollinis]MCY0387943.1 NTP transferase domain-containing protein [Robbsia betulipollinis]